MRTAGRLRAYARLLRDLGPWSAASVAPRGYERYEVELPARRPEHRRLRALVYVPTRRRPLGAYLLCPGLHYAGPAEARMDRFAGVLASAGILVLAPFFPDFLEMVVRPTVIADGAQAFEALLELEERPRGTKPGIFSISFGCLPALATAGSAALGGEVGAVLCFGAYADFATAIRFALGGDSGDGREHPRDPLNRPAVLINLIDDLPGAPRDPSRLLAAWRRYLTSTWGRAEMKLRERHEPVARALLPELTAEEQRLFLIGCGLEPGALELCERAIAVRQQALGFLDVRPHLAGIRCPVHLCHGADDDVIPHTQLALLAQALPASAHARTYLTGLYGHTGGSGLGRLLADLPGLAREAGTMARMLRALVQASRGR